jgi:hypothetical protein
VTKIEPLGILANKAEMLLSRVYPKVSSKERAANFQS